MPPGHHRSLRDRSHLSPGARSAILPTFFNSYLLFTEDVSTALFHAFTVLCYSFPLAGGFLSDRFLGARAGVRATVRAPADSRLARAGKFWTIFIVSIIYVIGAAMLSVSAIPGLMGAPGSVNPALSLVALFTIAVGTGGIKYARRPERAVCDAVC